MVEVEGVLEEACRCRLAGETALPPQSWITEGGETQEIQQGQQLGFLDRVASSLRDIRKFSGWLWMCGMTCPGPSAGGGGVTLDGTNQVSR